MISSVKKTEFIGQPQSGDEVNSAETQCLNSSFQEDDLYDKQPACAEISKMEEEYIPQNQFHPILGKPIQTDYDQSQMSSATDDGSGFDRNQNAHHFENQYEQRNEESQEELFAYLFEQVSRFGFNKYLDQRYPEYYDLYCTYYEQNSNQLSNFHQNNEQDPQQQQQPFYGDMNQLIEEDINQSIKEKEEEKIDPENQEFRQGVNNNFNNCDYIADIYLNFGNEESQKEQQDNQSYNNSNKIQIESYSDATYYENSQQQQLIQPQSPVIDNIDNGLEHQSYSDYFEMTRHQSISQPDQSSQNVLPQSQQSIQLSQTPYFTAHDERDSYSPSSSSKQTPVQKIGTNRKREKREKKDKKRNDVDDEVRIRKDTKKRYNPKTEQDEEVRQKAYEQRLHFHNHLKNFLNKSTKYLLKEVKVESSFDREKKEIFEKILTPYRKKTQKTDVYLLIKEFNLESEEVYDQYLSDIQTFDSKSIQKKVKFDISFRHFYLRVQMVDQYFKELNYASFEDFNEANDLINELNQWTRRKLRVFCEVDYMNIIFKTKANHLNLLYTNNYIKQVLANPDIME